MKKTLLLLALVAFVLSTGCQKIKDLATIKVDMPFSATDTTLLPPDLEVIIQSLPPGTNPNVWINLPTLGFPTYAQQNLDSFHTSASKVLSVSLGQLAIQLLPSTNNFNFIDSVYVTIQGKYLPAVAVAQKLPVDPTTNTLFFDVDQTQNLKNYFLQDSIYINLKAHFIAVPPSAATMQFFGKFHLIANPLD